MKPTLTRAISASVVPMFVMAGAVSAAGMSEPLATAPVAPVATPVMVPMTGSDWTGLYAGASLGYGKTSAEAGAADPFGEDPDGALYGVHVGYNYDFGTFVLGGELEYQATNISNDLTGIDVDGVARLKVRAGYDAGQFMPYVTAGVAQLYLSGGLDADDTGRFAGIGVDYKVADNMTVGGEVLYHKFDDFDDTGIDVEATTASLRVSFRF